MTPFERSLTAPATLQTLRKCAQRLTRNREDAEDLAQTTLMRALISHHTFQPDSNIAAWLCTICYNQHIQNYRKNRPLSFFDPQTEPNPATRLQAQPAQHKALLAKQALDIAAAVLSPKTRQALLLAAYDYKYSEIAAIAHIAEGTAKSRVWRGRRECSKHMV